MARYSEHDTSKTYAAADRFRDACLRRDGSLLFDEQTHTESLRAACRVLEQRIALWDAVSEVLG